jgi:hypothetical protein
VRAVITSATDSLVTAQWLMEQARGAVASMRDMPWIWSPSLKVHRTGWKEQSS